MTEPIGKTGPLKMRARIIDAAAGLLQEHGKEAVTTRRVAEAAGVQPPAIYRLFGDKDGLLDAVAEHVMATYVASKHSIVAAAAAADSDAVEDLRAGWNMQIEFGLANPVLFTILAVPGRGARSPAAQAGLDVLRSRVHRVAIAGRLRVSEPVALQMIQAAGTGAVYTLLSTLGGDASNQLPKVLFDAVLREILTDPVEDSDTGPAAAAIALRARAPELRILSEAERKLLSEWLDRVINERDQADS